MHTITAGAGSVCASLVAFTPTPRLVRKSLRLTLWRIAGSGTIVSTTILLAQIARNPLASNSRRPRVSEASRSRRLTRSPSTPPPIQHQSQHRSADAPAPPTSHQHQAEWTHAKRPDHPASALHPCHLTYLISSPRQLKSNVVSPPPTPTLPHHPNTNINTSAIPPRRSSALPFPRLLLRRMRTPWRR